MTKKKELTNCPNCGEKMVLSMGWCGRCGSPIYSCESLRCNVLTSCDCPLAKEI
jgi:predicted amidophosphoribosyltransferase